ncbi:MAG: type II toxin-antitoxin system Phd/YefM family antitoxin [Caulobacter sp.]|jgi:prevent-host-death family protein
MKQINVHQAKTQLSLLLAEVEAGGEVVIARAGKPVALLTRVRPQPAVRRKPGRLKGQIKFADDYDRADADIQAAFDESLDGEA